MKRTLPKKWYIKVNKSNLKELGKWRSAGAYGQMRPDNPFPCGYCTSETGYCTSETGFWMSSKPAGFTEITTAEFRKFVLKTPTVKKSPAKFTLPKRWKAILPIEDFGIVVGRGEAAAILKWFESYGYNTSGWNGNADVDYVYFVNKDKRVDCTCLKENIKQIFTLTQIKEMTQKTQKIVGYKAPTDLWDGDVKKGEIFILAGKANYCPKDNQIEELYIPKELVETWEPVYEEVIKSKVTNLGTPKRKFTIYKDKVEVVGGDEETRIFSNEQVDAIAKMFTSCTVRSLTTKVNSVQVGCDDGTSLTLGDIEIIKRTQSLL